MTASAKVEPVPVLAAYDRLVSAMSLSALLCLMWLFATGCFSTQTHKNTFVALQLRIQHDLADGCDCGPVTRTEDADRHFFEVSLRNSRFRILVLERQYFTQEQWERQYSSATNQVGNFLNLTSQHQTHRQASGVSKLLSLPTWSYDGIGLDVGLQEPEVTYAGIEQERAEAKKYLNQIVKLLKPYQTVNTTP